MLTMTLKNLNIQSICLLDRLWIAKNSIENNIIHARYILANKFDNKKKTENDINASEDTNTSKNTITNDDNSPSADVNVNINNHFYTGVNEDGTLRGPDATFEDNLKHGVSYGPDFSMFQEVPMNQKINMEPQRSITGENPQPGVSYGPDFSMFQEVPMNQSQQKAPEQKPVHKLEKTDCVKQQKISKETPKTQETPKESKQKTSIKQAVNSEPIPNNTPQGIPTGFNPMTNQPVGMGFNPVNMQQNTPIGFRPVNMPQSGVPIGFNPALNQPDSSMANIPQETLDKINPLIAEINRLQAQNAAIAQRVSMGNPNIMMGQPAPMGFNPALNMPQGMPMGFNPAMNQPIGMGFNPVPNTPQGMPMGFDPMNQWREMKREFQEKVPKVKGNVDINNIPEGKHIATAEEFNRLLKQNPEMEEKLKKGIKI